MRNIKTLRSRHACYFHATYVLLFTSYYSMLQFTLYLLLIFTSHTEVLQYFDAPPGIDSFREDSILSLVVYLLTVRIPALFT